ncbi:hypothetical protein CIB95_01570 [Lottiidibacillus patelloidae]|uniref:Spore coat protein CotZ n=1 Tax=Lottiidibacillus patelloidae TaxID=2670334 RepID=A0A263BYP1_9BACI|nr:CotY/CotZ family spore coat protein [Lottiidibacillus patelloidae]OZM58286.1 hypothetical protein CIB95_01570 [Lottiidibacillus patelloidae]
MGCGKNKKLSSGCIKDALNAILDAQDAIEDCPSSCFSNLLSPELVRGDTIPFTLRNNDGSPFYALGNVGRSSCFASIWFRVEEIRGKCATLRVLRPFKGKAPLDISDLVGKDECCISLEGQCKMKDLVKTDQCVEVDLTCFCAIQCLDPRLVR